MDSTGRRRTSLAPIVAALAIALSAIDGPPSASALAQAAPHRLAPVSRDGGDLTAGGRRFLAWGFNYGLADRYPILDYFARPTENRLRRLVADMRKARSLGANTLRVYLEIASFMRGARQPNVRALVALRALLERAERVGVYLDITGNLVWRAAPAWYDRLPERRRWAVQARFWRSVARTAAASPAVLAYELTSEPVIEESDRWYGGDFGGYTFVQRIVRRCAGRDARRLARLWIGGLRQAIRRYDSRHLIGLGLLPQTVGPFGAANVAGQLDVLMVHEYPAEGRAGEAVSVVRDFAAHRKPVILGETAPLLGTPDSWASFLRGARRHVDGYLSFYDGRAPSEVTNSEADSWYARMLEQFIGLRPSLVGTGH
jgi:hypothetical protein